MAIYKSGDIWHLRCARRALTWPWLLWPRWERPQSPLVNTQAGLTPSRATSLPWGAQRPPTIPLGANPPKSRPPPGSEDTVPGKPGQHDAASPGSTMWHPRVARARSPRLQLAAAEKGPAGKCAGSPSVEGALLKSAPNRPKTGGLLHTSTLHGEAAQAPTLSCKCGCPGAGGWRASVVPAAQCGQ